MLRDSGLDWSDKQDFEDAARGFIAKLETPTVTKADGSPVWDLTSYAFLDAEEAPATVNPSLWRQARVNMLHGLFKVTRPRLPGARHGPLGDQLHRGRHAAGSSSTR